MKKVSEIYDVLFKYESRSKKGYYPIHKKLNFPDGCEDIADWIISKNLCASFATVLDVGCGSGNTLFKLATLKQVSGLGISVSKQEIDFAIEQSKKNNLDHQLEFRKQSFDEPFGNEKFDIIIAIESLKHSENISLTINKLMCLSHQNTIFIIADDFLITPSRRSKEQIDYWNTPSLMSIIRFREVLNDYCLEKIQLYFLTDFVDLKSTAHLKILIFAMKFLKIMVHNSKAVLIEVYLGGLILELLYCKREMEYCIVVAQQNNKVLPSRR